MKEKIIALFLTAIMAAMYIIPAYAATNNLGTYPAPFCDSGVCNFYVVYGSKAKADDLVGGSDVATRLAAENYVLVSTSSGTSASVSGEGTTLDTPNNKILLGEKINDARQTITSNDLPTLLKSGEFTDSDGNAYTYTQDLTLDNDAQVAYSTSGGSLKDPSLLISLPTNVGTSNYIYSTRVTFSKLLNISDDTVIDNTITLFGNDYTIGSGSCFTSSCKQLILYGGANTVTLPDGQSQDVTVGGTTYTVKNDGANGVNTAVIEVNGNSKSVTQGNSYKISGLDVYVSSVYYYSKEAAVSSVKLSLGSQKLTLADSSQVLFGSSDYLDGSYVSLSGTALQGVSKIEVFISAKDADSDDIQIGNSFTDPVWKTFSLNFASTSPAANDPNSDSIVATYSGDKTLSVNFEDYLSNTANIEFAYNNQTSLTSTPTIWLMDSNSYPYIIKEGDPVYYKSYVIINQNDESHLLQLTNVPAGNVKDTDTVRFKDMLTGAIYEKTISPTVDCSATACNESMQVGSQTYYVQVYNASSAVGKTGSYVKITWDDSNQYTGCSGTTAATYGSPGTITLFPGLKAKNGEYIYLVNNYTSFTTNGTVCLPGNKLYTVDTTAATTTAASTGAQFNYTWTQTGGYLSMTPLKNNRVGIAILEGKQADGSTKSIVYVPGKYVGTNSFKIAVDTPTFSDTTSGLAGANGLTTMGSNSYVSMGYDVFGTLVTYDTSADQAKATILYPTDQMNANLFFLTNGAAVSTSSTGAGTVKKVVPIGDSISRLDTDIVDPTTVAKNLVLIGGSCANSLVQSLVDSGKLDAKYTCAGGTPGAGWVSGTGYIFYVANAFATGYNAIVIAGTNAIDTRNACSVMQKFDNTDIAAKLAGQTNVAVTAVSGSGITPLT